MATTLPAADAPACTSYTSPNPLSKVCPPWRRITFCLGAHGGRRTRECRRLGTISFCSSSDRAGARLIGDKFQVALSRRGSWFWHALRSPSIRSAGQDGDRCGVWKGWERTAQPDKRQAPRSSCTVDPPKPGEGRAHHRKQTERACTWPCACTRTRLGGLTCACLVAPSFHEGLTRCAA